jgi:hypothetical protein
MWGMLSPTPTVVSSSAVGTSVSNRKEIKRFGARIIGRHLMDSVAAVATISTQSSKVKESK